MLSSDKHFVLPALSFTRKDAGYTAAKRSWASARGPEALALEDKWEMPEGVGVQGAATG